VKAFRSEEEIKLTESYLHRESIREIPGRWFDSEAKAWYIPLTEKNIGLLQLLGAELNDELRELIKPSGKQVRDVEPIQRMPIRAAPYRHQIAAFNFAMKIFAEGKGGDDYDV